METTENKSIEVHFKKQNKTKPPEKKPKKLVWKNQGKALPYYLAYPTSWQKIYAIICIFNTDNWDLQRFPK